MFAITSCLLMSLAGPAGLDFSASSKPVDEVPSIRRMIEADTDLWGEAAMRQPNGASYEFFANLLPPVRYADTEFRHYPVVLSAPLARTKARFISNGSAINARANKKPMWREIGFPVTFVVGTGGEIYGTDLDRLEGPSYAEGWLPVVRTAYRSSEGVCEQEAFAAVEPELADKGMVFVAFRGRGGGSVRVGARIGAERPLTAGGGALRDMHGRMLVLAGPGWAWDAAASTLACEIGAGSTAVLAVCTEPLAGPADPLTGDAYQRHRQACLEEWRGVMAGAIALETPERRVNDAWRAMVVGNLMLGVGTHMNYSAGNAYDHLYEAECGDIVRSMMLYGYTGQARRMVGPLLDFYRQATRFHVAGHKLQLLAHYYWVTRDAAGVREKQPIWRSLIDFILDSREPDSGLLPKDRYAGDIDEPVHSLSSHAACWRGLRDVSAVLEELGDADEARRVRGEADRFRRAILEALARSERHDVQPPYLPISLLGNEEPPVPLNATHKGSYYCLMAPYILDSGVLGYGSQREGWLLERLERQGGIAMGMIRSTPHQGQFKDQPGVNVLYGLRYQLALLRRDEREKALVGFYGQLAQATTRDTYIGGEGSRFLHGDARGRSFYLPPNAAGNAMFMQVLRYLLIQDWDLDEDGRPETLRLLYGVPRRWLLDGARIRLENAPTAFGPVSLDCRSNLSRGEVVVRVHLADRPPPLPPTPARRVFIRVPLPEGWEPAGVRVGQEAVGLAPGGSLDLTGRSGPLEIRLLARPRS
jgi:hypothetical protein